MKLYMHPVSTAARPVRLLIAENSIACDEELVDLTTGAHHQEPYASLNPSRLVPMLDDDGFRLTESSAILKYLADKYDLAVYPKDLKKRARVNEVMGLKLGFHSDKLKSDDDTADAVAVGKTLLDQLKAGSF